jgi:hypothetical protein
MSASPIPTSAKGAASKASHVFTTYILPIAAFGCGYFAGVMLFAPLAAWIAEIAAEGSTTTGTTFDIASAFGGHRNGIAIITALVIAGIGFYLVKDGQPWVSVGLFMLGAALSIGIKGLKGQSLAGA